MQIIVVIRFVMEFLYYVVDYFFKGNNNAGVGKESNGFIDILTCVFLLFSSIFGFVRLE